MREIKFRAWHKELEEYLSRDGRSWHHYGPNIVDGVLRSEDCTIEQFTGLHDKNGKEIYEGDIVMVDSFYGSFVSVIEYVNAGFEYKNKYNNKAYSRCEFGNTFEVIGNIHENELVGA